jgi:hypothetical protein
VLPPPPIRAGDPSRSKLSSTVTLRFRLSKNGRHTCPEDTRVPSWFRNQESNLDCEIQSLESCRLDDSEIAVGPAGIAPAPLGVRVRHAASTPRTAKWDRRESNPLRAG